jgi:hypothetical protein
MSKSVHFYKIWRGKTAVMAEPSSQNSSHPNYPLEQNSYSVFNFFSKPRSQVKMPNKPIERNLRYIKSFIKIDLQKRKFFLFSYIKHSTRIDFLSNGTFFGVPGTVQFGTVRQKFDSWKNRYVCCINR